MGERRRLPAAAAADDEGEAVEPGSPPPLDTATAETVQPTALDLDRLIHERMRLGIVSALAVNDHLSFNDLKKLLQTTDGNLSVHARKLEEAGYVACKK